MGFFYIQQGPPLSRGGADRRRGRSRNRKAPQKNTNSEKPHCTTNKNLHFYNVLHSSTLRLCFYIATPHFLLFKLHLFSNTFGSYLVIIFRNTG